MHGEGDLEKNDIIIEFVFDKNGNSLSVRTAQKFDLLVKCPVFFRRKAGMFYDLGCGTGKPVFAAAAVYPWKRCIGMEILNDLHGICERALQVSLDDFSSVYCTILD